MESYLKGLSVKAKYLLMLALLACNWSSHANTQQTATACGHEDYPPWNWLSDGEIKGVCAHVVKALFAEEGIDIDLNYVGPWARCQRGIEQGEVDINICSIINPKRQVYSEFIDTPMGYNEQVLLVHKARSFDFAKWEDLAGKTTGLVLGVSIGQQFDEFLNRYTHVFRVQNSTQSLKMLQSGRIDFVPMGRYSANLLLQMMELEDEIAILPVPIVSGELHIGLSRRSKYRDLLPVIEAKMQTSKYRTYVRQLLKIYTRAYLDEWQHAPQANARETP